LKDGATLTDEKINELIRVIDADHDGYITLTEMQTYLALHKEDKPIEVEQTNTVNK